MQDVSTPHNVSPPSLVNAHTRRLAGLAALAAVYLLVAYVAPKPPALTVKAWQLTALFIATILGLVTTPMPGGAVVLLSVVCAAMLGLVPMEKALAGYADPTVWLVLGAFFISRALLNTGLARRIALGFVRMFGKSSLGVVYALGLSDVVLASIIPSIAARSGGIILPICRSIAELYGSQPGATARRIGAFLMVGVYPKHLYRQRHVLYRAGVHPLAAKIATESGFPIDYASWFFAGSVPGIVSLIVVPWVVMKLYPPEVTHTPEASEFARAELQKMGPISRNEWILLFVFLGVCGLWITSTFTKIDITLTALMGGVALLVTGVLTWEDVKAERTGWDIFLWYGGLYMLGKQLNDTKVTTELAKFVGGAVSGTGWVAMFVVCLLVYFYVHYGFASITAHVLAMYPPFLSVLVLKGAPIGLVAFGFATFANLAACLTHYGTTPAPMFFAQDYASMRDWWRIGLLVSFLTILIWGTVGFGWWKVLGIW